MNKENRKPRRKGKTSVSSWMFVVRTKLGRSLTKEEYRLAREARLQRVRPTDFLLTLLAAEPDAADMRLEANDARDAMDASSTEAL